MIDVTLFDELKKYLTKEFMTLSRQKDEMLCEKVNLEVEQQKENDQLFENKNALRIKRLFSPLDDEIFEEEMSSFQNDKIKQKLQNIENNLRDVESTMKDIKKYLCFVQMMENDSKKEKEKQLKRKVEASSDIKKMLEEVVAFLQEEYPNTELLLDFEEENRLMEEKFNSYLIQVLADTIRTSIETMKADTVMIEGKVSDGTLWLSLQMLLENNLIDQCSYQYEITLKNQ